jgi:8-oxo-dGTP diphosphatase
LNVLLIKKNRPEKQKGLYNGIGGLIENESPLQAMIRECKEESGLYLPENHWNYLIKLKLKVNEEKYVYLHYFSAFTEMIYDFKQFTDEEQSIFEVSFLPENLQTIVHVSILNILLYTPIYKKIPFIKNMFCAGMVAFSILFSGMAASSKELIIVNPRFSIFSVALSILFFGFTKNPNSVCLISNSFSLLISTFFNFFAKISRLVDVIAKSALPPTKSFIPDIEPLLIE